MLLKKDFLLLSMLKMLNIFVEIVIFVKLWTIF